MARVLSEVQEVIQTFSAVRASPDHVFYQAG
jgi:hypothetical protein